MSTTATDTSASATFTHPTTTLLMYYFTSTSIFTYLQGLVEICKEESNQQEALGKNETYPLGCHPQFSGRKKSTWNFVEDSC